MDTSFCDDIDFVYAPPLLEKRATMITFIKKNTRTILGKNNVIESVVCPAIKIDMGTNDITSSTPNKQLIMDSSTRNYSGKVVDMWVSMVYTNTKHAYETPSGNREVQSSTVFNMGREEFSSFVEQVNAYKAQLDIAYDAAKTMVEARANSDVGSSLPEEDKYEVITVQ